MNNTHNTQATLVPDGTRKTGRRALGRKPGEFADDARNTATTGVCGSQR